jgi:hypothetical protein
VSLAVKRLVVLIVSHLVALGFTGGGLSAFAQHVHLAVGAESQQQNAKLLLVNGASYDIFSYGGTNSACFFMTDTDPLYPNYYQSDVTLVSLPATLWTGGPAPGCAAQGAYIETILKSVAGPPGGVIGFWQENDDGTGTTEIFEVPIGTTGGTNRFNLTEGEVGAGVDTPDGPDPFGHIHGRRFTANKPGLYTVGFQFIDTSQSGTDGGPIHTPSKTNFFYFQAGLYLDSIVKTNDAVTVKFGTRAFKNYDLECNTNLAGTNWFKVNGFVGANHSDMHLLTDFNATNSVSAYRLHELPQ